MNTVEDILCLELKLCHVVSSQISLLDPFHLLVGMAIVIILLESRCPLVGSSVGDEISAKFQRTISRQRKELPEIRWYQNDRIFEGFLDFWTKMMNWPKITKKAKNYQKFQK